MSVSPDLPPDVRPLKDELMEIRAKLPPQTKQKSRVKYIAQWPFIELRIDGQDPRRPSSTLTDMATKVLGIAPLMTIKESVEALTPSGSGATGV